MNKENVRKVLERYILNYEILNDSEHNEIYKWTAVNHFQKYWYIEEADFGEMFRKAMEKSENIIDNKKVQPVGGIVFLCRQNRAAEEKVRDEFRKLLIDDEGNIVVRQRKIDNFVENINLMLQKEAPGKWKYEQDRRAAIMYLSFIAPSDNYMFKATETKAFANYCEFGDNIGGGQTFRLDYYYRMCRELVEEIKANSRLCILLEKELDRRGLEVDVDTSYNILAYDIIYCAYSYNLYGETTPSKKKFSNNPYFEEKQIERLSPTDTQEDIKNLVYYVRGQAVMLDSDLAAMYQVETKVFNQAVNRNIERFPENFRFQLTNEEYESLRSQIVTSSGWGGRRYMPYAFTEQGIAMLSGLFIHFQAPN